jgi:hypothetical protein
MSGTVGQYLAQSLESKSTPFQGITSQIHQIRRPELLKEGETFTKAASRKMETSFMVLLELSLENCPYPGLSEISKPKNLYMEEILKSLSPNQKSPILPSILLSMTSS